MRILKSVVVWFCLVSWVWIASGQNVARMAGNGRSVALQGNNTALNAIYFSTYAGVNAVPLYDQAPGGGIYVSEELAPVSGVPGSYAAGYFYYLNSAYSSYGTFMLTMPTTDSDQNGLPDFCQLDQPVNTDTSGTMIVGSSFPPVTLYFDGHFSRAAGSVSGTFTVSCPSPGCSLGFSGGTWQVASYAGTFTYTRGSSNGATVLYSTTDGSGTVSTFGGSCQFSVDNTDRISLPEFVVTGTNGTTGSLTVLPSVFARSGTKYRGNLSVADGDPYTSWADFTDYVFEVTDLNDSDQNGIPDLSDVLPAYTLSLTNWTIPAGSATTNVIVTCGPASAWTVVNPAPDWLSLIPTNGVGSNFLSIIATANSNALSRSATLTIAGQSLIVTQAGAPGVLAATQSAWGYQPGTNVTITCSLSYTGAPSTLGWSATIPPGWSYLSGSGEPGAKPAVGAGGTLVWSWSAIATNPVTFSYTLRVPVSDTGPKSIQATMFYQDSNGSQQPAATPNPLVLLEAAYHTADYRAPFGQMDGTEVNRVLSYWRAGGYHRDAAGADGFAPGVGATNGLRHAADFRAPYWQMDGTEVNRVLSYWRAGGYHPDPNGVDGYAPGAP